jgi:hypothetical protein
MVEVGSTVAVDSMAAVEAMVVDTGNRPLECNGWQRGAAGRFCFAAIFR